MSLPVSHYEALLAEVRGLRRKAQRVQQLATPLISNCSSDVNSIPLLHQNDEVKFRSYLHKMDSLLLTGRHNGSSTNVDGAATSSAEGDTTCSEDEFGHVPSTRTNISVSSEPIPHCDRLSSTLYHGTWPVERNMWNSEPTANRSAPTAVHNHHMQEVTSVMSFASSSGGMHMASPCLSRRSSQQLEAKVDMVYSLLAMLSGQEHADMGETLLALSTNPESCLAMRQSGCIPLLVQMVQSDREPEARRKATQALHNLVHSQPDEKLKKREVRIFKLLEQTRGYTEALRGNQEYEEDLVMSEDGDKHPVQTVAHLMKLSFDELHRQAICTLGGIFIIAMLVEAEHVNHGSITDEQHCILMRRYACMALTNLTFGDSGNKALLCSFREFMRALVIQLQSPSDELRQVTASVLRNLSWRADSSSKEILREVGSVTGLMKAAMLDNRENTLKSILSALWNLSAHCTENKSEICSVGYALGFLVDMLTYKTPSKSLAIIENSGGILRNISSQIAVRDDYRDILRQHNCLQILLDQLKSPSLTIVSNACGTLWNLSAKCPIDQEALWQMGAPAMLRSLNHSKHKMIAMGSSAALKNLLSARPTQTVLPVMDSAALAMDLPVLPTLGARKQKALLQDLDHTLSETYENIEKDSPVKSVKDERTHDFIQKPMKKSPDFKYGYDEPSTSYDGLERRSFVKSKAKRHVSSGSEIEEDNRNFHVFTDSGLQSLDVDGSPSSSIDNDKYKRREMKIKEGSVYSDEKDHCSIEDASDSDNQSSLGMEQKLLHEDSSYSADAFVARKEMPHSSASTTPNLPHPSQKYTSLASSNITMFEGDIDEIDMDDISIHFPPEPESNNEVEEHLEKQDSEKEKTDDKNLTKSKNSGIPLPRQIPVSTSTDADAVTKRSHRTSGLPRRSLPTSTPIRISNPRPDDSSIETCKTQSIDIFDLDDTAASPDVKNELVSLTDVECTLPVLEGFSEEFRDSRNNDQADLNISQETNISTSPPMDLKPTPPSAECSYLTPEAYALVSKDRLLERSCEENNPVDNRMLDPDAMIESLDRFTAELVSQASHLQSNKDNTWNEDTSPNEVTFPSISGSAPNVITFDDSPPENIFQEISKQPESNDFSSINTSTMTESTLIAIEATKMATVFKTEAEMSQSMTSVANLELDKVQPPSLMHSLSCSPKLTPRKRSLPKAVVLRRALSNSLNNASSLESLHSLSALDQVNPPSAMGEVFDMEGSTTSVASLPGEIVELKTDFLVNGAVNRLIPDKSTNISYLLTTQSYNMNSMTDLENINPPSLFNEITDLCNSLADVCTEAIGSETELFEDCRSHVLPTEDEFSDANSATPMQSDQSSPETSPKKVMSLKQRRKIAGDRYKTYTVPVEEEMQSTSEDYKTVTDETYSVKSKLTPREKRQLDRSRFETKVIDKSVIDILPVISPTESPQTSPARSKLSIRRNFMQKRLENRDRFKTQTLEEPCFSPEMSGDSDLHLMVQREANLVLKSLRETKTGDELLDCETLSLVSNDDDSERNSGSPVNYRTYHKSWGLKKNIPVIEPPKTEEISCTPPPEVSDEEDPEPAKPKIVKPLEVVEEPVETRGIRGRRKPLYSKTPSKIAPRTLKPLKTITSNLVKNVTSAIKPKPPPTPPSRVSSGYGTKPSTPSKVTPKPKLERQGTFTKDEPVPARSRIPTPGASKIKPPTKIPAKARPLSSASSDRGTKPARTNYNRSTSADSREAVTRRIQTSGSSQSLKVGKTPKTGSNTSLNSSGTSTKKQVTSKIASLWKKIEETKNKQQIAKKDTRVWIASNGGQGQLTRSNTFDNKNGVTLRNKTPATDTGKRVSRLGSFIVMDDAEDGVVVNVTN